MKFLHIWLGYANFGVHDIAIDFYSPYWVRPLPLYPTDQAKLCGLGYVLFQLIHTSTSTAWI